MIKMQTTIILIVSALVLGVLAYISAPSFIPPEEFNDTGEILFPNFADPLGCFELEVYEPNADSGDVKTFKVRKEGALWRIPSHNGYPADAKERMANAAASIIGLKKDRFFSDKNEDQKAFGVEDPLDDASSIEGKGKRIIMKDASGQVLADVIIGKQMEGEQGDMFSRGGRQIRDWAYMRMANSKRIYGVNMRGGSEGYGELLKDVSTTFSEWIDTDLLHMERDSATQITLNNYTVDEESHTVKDQVTHVLRKEDDKWVMDGLTDEEQVKEDATRDLTSTLDSLTIAGVRPTPEQLDRMSLASKGFFVNQDGALFGNEGQMEVKCKDGVNYHLFFGEILFGSGEEITAGTKKEEQENPGDEEKEVTPPSENRYLFVRVSLDDGFKKECEEEIAKADEGVKLAEAEIKKAEAEKADNSEADKEDAKKEDGDAAVAEGDEAAKKEEKVDWKAKKTEWESKKKEWDEKLKKANERIADLNLRFSKWYYVITGDSFVKLRLERTELVELKVPDTSNIGEQPENKEMKPIKNPSGLSYLNLKTGSGQAAQEGDTVKVHYTGWLKDGTEFDKSDPENPFTFKLTKGTVIDGWVEGVKGMSPGGKRKLIIPPDLGYKEAGQGEKIPPNAILIFDVEVVEVNKSE